MIRLFLPALVLGLSACAGYRGGWESVAYIGDPPTTMEYRTPYEAYVRSELSVRGLRMHIMLNNQLRTYDTQVYLFILPLSFDAREVYTQVPKLGKTRVQIHVTPTEPGFVFRPKLGVINFAEKKFNASTGFEFGRWDPEWNRVTEGGRWDYRPVESEFHLKEGVKYYLSIDFDMPIPSPQTQGISLDLSSALSSPDQPPIPLIRFVPSRWKEGYT